MNATELKLIGKLLKCVELKHLTTVDASIAEEYAIQAMGPKTYLREVKIKLTPNKLKIGRSITIPYFELEHMFSFINLPKILVLTLKNRLFILQFQHMEHLDEFCNYVELIKGPSSYSNKVSSTRPDPELEYHPVESRERPIISASQSEDSGVAVHRSSIPVIDRTSFINMGTTELLNHHSHSSSLPQNSRQFDHRLKRESLDDHEVDHHSPIIVERNTNASDERINHLGISSSSYSKTFPSIYRDNWIDNCKRLTYNQEMDSMKEDPHGEIIWYVSHEAVADSDDDDSLQEGQYPLNGYF